MNGQDKTSFEVIPEAEKRKSVFRGKSPWLKIGVFVVVIFFFLIFGLGWFRGDAGKIGENETPVSPMQVQAKVPMVAKIDLKDKKLVALTFDDGPGKATTPKLLDILEEKGVRATFFTLGTAAANNPEIVKREAAEGHEVASHTMNHKQFNKLASSAVKSEIEASTRVLEGILGQRPTLLRPPYGAINQTVSDVAQMPMILWTVDTLDWKNKDTESILGNTKAQVFDGAIILMHDIYPTTVEAVAEVIDWLRGEGYEFLTVSELASFRGKTLNKGESYGSFRP